MPASRNPPVAEQQHGRVRGSVEVVVAHRGERDASTQCLLPNRASLVAHSELHRDVQARADAVHPGFRQGLGQRFHQNIPFGAVAHAHAAQVPVQLAPAEKIGEGVLVDPGDAKVHLPLALLHGVKQPGRHHQPAQPQRRREGLARRAGVDDVLRIHRLQRSDRRPVVPVLGVVIVLHGEPAGPAEPFQQRAPPLTGEHGAGRVLVRRRDDHRIDLRLFQPLDPHPVGVHRHRHQGEPRADHRVPHLVMAGILYRDPPGAPRHQGPAHQRATLAVAAGDHDAGRVTHHPSHAAQIVPERVAQHLGALRIGVAEVGVAHGGERFAERAEPDRAGKGREIGDARAEVVLGLGGRCRPGARGFFPSSGAAGNPRTGAGAELQVPLPGELRVGVRHDGAGDAQLAGQVTG